MSAPLRRVVGVSPALSYRPKPGEIPTQPGVYRFRDRTQRVIYVGKAKNLRARAGSYFLKAAAEDRRTADLGREIRDVDYLEADSEVDEIGRAHV